MSWTKYTSFLTRRRSNSDQHDDDVHNQSRKVFQQSYEQLEHAAQSATTKTKVIWEKLVITMLTAVILIRQFFSSLLLWLFIFPFEILREVIPHWINEGVDSLSPRFVRERRLLQQLNDALCFDEWKAIGKQLDELHERQYWKMAFESRHYDYILVKKRLEQLKTARRNDDHVHLAWLIRATLDRNLGGMGNANLFNQCFVGTKDLIEQYIDEVTNALDYLATTEVPNMSQEEKIKMFAETRQAYGLSALLLSGGGGLGIHHFGVIKALHEMNVLPRIISGSSAGSLVASLICTTKDDQLEELLSGRQPLLKNTYLMSRPGDTVTFWDRVQHFVESGVLADVNVLKDACEANIGNITFQEAYNRTRRILNITINSRNANEPPRLLNYLTAPNVIIWSAACASCALDGLFDPVEVLAKDKHGNIHPWNVCGQKWSDGSMQSDLPMDRLAELFNVNHFIVSQVNPHVVPFLRAHRVVSKKIFKLISAELVHRMTQLMKLGLLPSGLNNVKTMLSQKYEGDITIIPDIEMEDYLRILENPDQDALDRAMRTGQLATWPKMSMIQTHLQIELKLDTIIAQLRGSERWSLT